MYVFFCCPGNTRADPSLQSVSMLFLSLPLSVLTVSMASMLQRQQLLSKKRRGAIDGVELEKGGGWVCRFVPLRLSPAAIRAAEEVQGEVDEEEEERRRGWGWQIPVWPFFWQSTHHYGRLNPEPASESQRGRRASEALL